MWKETLLEKKLELINLESNNYYTNKTLDEPDAIVMGLMIVPRFIRVDFLIIKYIYISYYLINLLYHNNLIYFVFIYLFILYYIVKSI